MRVWWFAVFFLPMSAFGQHSSADISPEKKLHYYFTLYSQSDGKLAPSIDPVREHVAKLRNRRAGYKSDKAFVYALFHRTQQRFLKTFDASASFSDLLAEERFNCLTATALYSLLLDHFDVPFAIAETNYHAFILVELKEGRILLETTDRVNGFVDDEREIRKRMERYRTQKVVQTNQEAQYYEYKTFRIDSVSLTGMLGLLHYNNAVREFNDRNFKRAVTHLHHAFLLHRSPKLDAFRSLLYTTVSHSELIDEKSRKLYLARLTQLGGETAVPAVSLMIPLIR